MTLAPDDPRHGTYNGYKNHRCRCDDCRRAHSADPGVRRRNERYRRKLGAKPMAEHRAAIEPGHGTESRYNGYRCRCDDCRRASREARARRRKAAA